jgi:hypothetical protein
MKHLLGLPICVVAFLAATGSASAQSSEPLEPLVATVFGTFGLQGDLGGAVNSSGVGVLSGLRAEIDANTWGERYDTALSIRIGGAYNLTTRSQVFADITWDQAEADTADAGLIGGQPLQVKFSDYQGWGVAAGYRYYLPIDATLKPFVAVATGLQRLQEITVSLTGPSFNAADVPFYDDSWVLGWRIGGGFVFDINQRISWLTTLDIKYSGPLSDQSGIGTVGFERINDVGNRWTVPVMTGIGFKF